jgi:hypothetical protein
VKPMNGRKANANAGLRKMNRNWLISRAPKLASDARVISARFRSA